jgi:hypothetical protein
MMACMFRLAGGPEKLAMIVESVLGAVHNDSDVSGKPSNPLHGNFSPFFKFSTIPAAIKARVPHPPMLQRTRLLRAKE